MSDNGRKFISKYSALSHLFNDTKYVKVHLLNNEHSKQKTVPTCFNLTSIQINEKNKITVQTNKR